MTNRQLFTLLLHNVLSNNKLNTIKTMKINVKQNDKLTAFWQLQLFLALSYLILSYHLIAPCNGALSPELIIILPITHSNLQYYSTLHTSSHPVNFRAKIN